MRVTDELRVLVALSRWFPWDYGNAWPTYTVLARRIRRSEADTRAAVAKLVEAGYLRHGPAWDPEGIPCGSGYFLTPLFYRESGATP